MKRWLTNFWVIATLIAVIAALVLCVGLPLLIIDLRSWRWPLLLLIVAIWAAAAAWRVWRARRAAAALAAAVAGDSEAGIVGQRLGDALAQLKSSGGGKRDYLYARPWYVVIGPPGGGKTTALKASGLRFSVVDQALKGAGGTRNLDFWFAEEAVLVDTAGRYTTQDSDAGEDAQGWSAFLDAVKKHRPRQPINGVLVAMPVDQIASIDRAGIDAHAAAVRRRLTELTDRLQIDIPVYLLFTKADLLAGFTEYFDDLDVEGRRAVLGRTFEAKDKPADADSLADAFDEVAQAVADRQAKRLAAEPDMARRGLLLGFPSQLASLRARLVRFTEGAFAPGERSGPPATLRGLYFSSGTQAGTPLDRLLGGMAEVYNAPQQAAGGAGRAYFLNRLLGEVILPEAGLASLRAGATRRQRLRATGGVFAVAAVAALVLLLWTVSFARNRAEQGRLLDAAQRVEKTMEEEHLDLRQVSAIDAPLEDVLPVLDQLRDLPGGAADRAAGYPSLFSRFGLWQSGLSEEAVAAYEQGLHRILLPRLLLRAEAVLGEKRTDKEGVYEPLKAYLMLGAERPGGPDAGALKRWITADWQNASLSGAERADQRKSLAAHLDALLAAADLSRVWANQQAPLNQQLVDTARETVNHMLPAERAYAVLKQGAATMGQDWSAADTLQARDDPAFANGPEVRGMTVPFFFTHDGLVKAYGTQLPKVAEQLRADAWMLGQGAAGEGGARLAALRPQIATQYARDYEAAWDAVVARIKPAALFSNPDALHVFTQKSSPFAKVLAEVRRQTTFSGPDATSAATSPAESAIRTRVTSAAGRGGSVVTAATAGAGSSGGPDAGAQITQHFADLSAYVGDGGPSSPIGMYIDAVSKYAQALDAQKSPGATGSTALADQAAQALAALKTQAGQAPPALGGPLSAVAGGGATAGATVVQGNLTQAYTSTVLPACKSATERHYPFYSASTSDASLDEVKGVFGPPGSMTDFVQQRLKPLLDESGPVWHWKAGDTTAATLDAASADHLTLTTQITTLLSNGQDFSVELMEHGPGIDAVELAVGGASPQHFDDAQKGPRPFQWRPDGLQEARLTWFKGGQRVEAIEPAGAWGLLHLFDKARRANDGVTAFKLTFNPSSPDRSFTLRITLPREQSPFGHGMWNFRCPTAL